LLLSLFANEIGRKQNEVQTRIRLSDRRDFLRHFNMVFDYPDALIILPPRQ